MAVAVAEAAAPGASAIVGDESLLDDGAALSDIEDAIIDQENFPNAVLEQNGQSQRERILLA